MKVEKVKSAVISLSETIGDFQMRADVSINDGSEYTMPKNGSITNGEVLHGTNIVGTFVSQSASTLSENYAVEDADLRMEVHKAVQQFCVTTREMMLSVNINGVIDEKN